MVPFGKGRYIVLADVWSPAIIGSSGWEGLRCGYPRIHQTFHRAVLYILKKWIDVANPAMKGRWFQSNDVGFETENSPTGSILNINPLNWDIKQYSLPHQAIKRYIIVDHSLVRHERILHPTLSQPAMDFESPAVSRVLRRYPDVDISAMDRKRMAQVWTGLRLCLHIYLRFT